MLIIALGVVAALLLAGVLSAIALRGHGNAASSTSNASTGGLGTPTNIPVPRSLLHLPLTNEQGHTVTLSSWPGKTVLLVPFLTLCQDICPMTTGNLVQVESSLRADRASRQVQIVELSVDPARDTPARLAAYARLTGAHWQLVTESPWELRALARFLGFSYQQVSETDSQARDWWTGNPLAYDVDHTDNYFVIDPQGVERVENDAAPAFHGSLNPKLYRFLDPLGRQHLQSAPRPDWTPGNALKALALSMHRSLSVTSVQ